MDLLEKAMKSAEDMRTQLTRKAFVDADFREKLISDPKATMCEEFGVELPDSLKIIVHESDYDTIHLAIPPKTQLDEEQLEMVAAGLSCCCI